MYGLGSMSTGSPFNSVSVHFDKNKGSVAGVVFEVFLMAVQELKMMIRKKDAVKKRDIVSVE
jgi:hypothetical protein